MTSNNAMQCPLRIRYLFTFFTLKMQQLLRNVGTKKHVFTYPWEEISSLLEVYWKGTNFRDLGAKLRKSRKFIPTKVYTIKVTFINDMFKDFVKNL